MLRDVTASQLVQSYEGSLVSLEKFPSGTDGASHIPGVFQLVHTSKQQPDDRVGCSIGASMHLLGAMTVYVQHLDGVWYVCHHEPRNSNGREPGLTSMARNCHIVPMSRQHMQHNLSAESFHPFSHRSRPVWQTRTDGTNSPSKRATVANSILLPSPTTD